MTSGSVADVRVRREQILSVASGLFRKHGFDRTSLRQIAESLNLSKSGLYHYFAAKDQIMHALVDPLLERVEGLLAGESAQLTTGDDRRAFLAAYLDAVVDFRDVTSLLGSDIGLLAHPELGQRIDSINRELVQRLSGPAPDDPAQVRATHALTGLQVVVIRFPHLDPVLLRDLCLRAAVASLNS